MSHYEYTHMERRFSVDTALSGGCVYVTAQPTNAPLYGMYIPSPAVATVAAELLKAAGRSELAEMIEAVEADRTARVEREAAEKKLAERRDAVAGEILQNDSDFPLADYASLPWYTQNAINRIIELATILEDAATS